jgi:starvation-inducible DNA-binding protein
MSKAKPTTRKSPAAKAPRAKALAATQAAIEPTLHQQPARGAGKETQRYGELVPMPHGLPAAVVQKSVAALNQVLADTITLRDMYKKHHWQVVGPTFNQLHLLFDTHFEAQVKLVDLIAERIQILGGVSLAMAADIAEETRIARPPRGREPAAVQLSRLIDAHTMIIKYAREQAEKASDAGDPGTDDLLVSDVVRTNELQGWFLSEHLVAASPV